MSISDRMKLLVEAKLPKYGRFQELEKLTKIKNATWQTWARGRQRPTEFMIQAIAWVWPEHAFWLVTGEELPSEGLSNPAKEQSREHELLTEFTGRVLKTRLAIRHEVSAEASLNVATSDPAYLNENALEDYADKLTKLALSERFTYSKNSANGELEGNFDDEIERQVQKTIAEDKQLKELEETRNRLIRQALTNLEAAASK